MRREPRGFWFRVRAGVCGRSCPCTCAACRPVAFAARVVPRTLRPQTCRAGGADGPRSCDPAQALRGQHRQYRHGPPLLLHRCPEDSAGWVTGGATLFGSAGVGELPARLQT